MIPRKYTLTACALILALAAAPALATTTYSDVTGSTVSYTGIQETPNPGNTVPAGPLFGAPALAGGNQLVFFPPAFTAQATGPNDFSSVGAQLQLMISSNSPTTTIDELMITEFGDASILGTGGAGGTGTFVSVAGFVTVLETTAGAIAPEVFGFTGTYTPSQILDDVSNIGTTIWSASVDVDIAALLAGEGITDGATKVMLSFDNDLMAYTDANGINAKIQKKVVDGPAVIVDIIPEPGTGLLLASGLIALGLRGRRSH